LTFLNFSLSRSDKLARAVGTRVSIIAELRTSICPAIFTAGGIAAVEEFLEEQVAIAAAQYGKYTEEYVAVLTDCAHCLSTQPVPERSPQQHKYIMEAIKCAKETFLPNSPRCAVL
jgi:hypothetical protein